MNMSSARYSTVKPFVGVFYGKGEKREDPFLDLLLPALEIQSLLNRIKNVFQHGNISDQSNVRFPE